MVKSHLFAAPVESLHELSLPSAELVLVSLWNHDVTQSYRYVLPVDLNTPPLVFTSKWGHCNVHTDITKYKDTHFINYSCKPIQ